MRSVTVEEAAALLGRLDHMYILTHERPDGDTLGSAAALCLGLRDLGKKVYVLRNPDLTPRYEGYVAGCLAASDTPPDDAVLVAVDIAAPERIPETQRRLAPRVILSIDHHPGDTRLGVHSCVRTDSASTGEIIFRILRALSVPLTPDIALPLYLALSTDTGCFLFANTTPDTHRVAAALLDTGIDVVPVNREMFETKSRRRFQVEALMIESMEFYCDGAVAVCFLTMDMRERTGAGEDDIDNIAALPRKIQDVEVGVVIKEMPDGVCRISVRSSEKCDASRVCARLGGGGHIRAAGATLRLPLPEVRLAVLQAVEVEMQNAECGMQK